MGLSYGIPTATVDSWMEDNATNYPDAGLVPPAQVRAANRDRAVALAIAQADQRKKAVKVVVSSANWLRTAGIQNDHVQSLGRYKMSAATAVIASPGPAGRHPIKLAQQAHIEDGYDFARSNPGEDGFAQQAANVAVDGFELGIAKWYFVYGDGSQIHWEGLR